MNETDRGSTSFEVTFTKLGRGTNVPEPFVISDVAHPVDIESAVLRAARPHLMSTGIDVGLNLDEGKGYVYAGVHCVGRFDITELGTE
jgi:hypothetical protein